MNTKDTLKEYYIKLQEMYNNAVNILTAINQSLSTTASEVTVDILDKDDNINTVRIPSFLYLENKLEQLDSNFSSLFKMPESGEAWFNKASSMYKLELVKSSSAPAAPIFDYNNVSTQFGDSWLLKDMVSPKTYMRFKIDNIGDNITQMFMKKIVIFSQTLFDTINSSQISRSYENYKAALYNFEKGIDYEEYDSILDMPVRIDEYRSEFKIVEIPELENGNPWNDYSVGEDGHQHLQYKIRLDTIQYHNQEDLSINYNLQPGDFICLANDYVVYKVKNVYEDVSDDNATEYYIIIEEYIGHVALQTFYENQNMIFELYNNNYNKYHYVDVPLEENPYIIVFLATIYNNVRSNLSNGILLDLNTIYMRDQDGNIMYKNGSPQSYISYYKENCKNIGDLILGLSDTAYPQLSNYSPTQLNIVVNGPQLLTLINQSLTNTDIVVKRINSHLVDDENSHNMINLHEEKSQLNSQLTVVQNNIDSIYNQLVSTDFNQEISVTQESLRSQLDTYYQERIMLQKQLIAVVDNINVLKGSIKGITESKYRVRGIVDPTAYELYIKTTISSNINIIGMEVEYKYSSNSLDTTNVTNINNSLFTDWIRQESIDRQRKLVFDEDGAYKIEFENYDALTNIIKWNQIDIPINNGEDVNIRIRFKYNIGQPFIDIYSPWSTEISVAFPAEYEENTEISSIISQNNNDVISSMFNKTLINDGYEEHIANKLIDGSQTFYHMPENIYSGFNTPENSLISLKDKLLSMSVELDKYKSLIDAELNSQYKVYLEYDNTSVELSNSTENEIFVNNTNNSIETFNKKKMNLIIRNVGTTAINLYSIFPGNINIPLLCSYEQFYKEYIKNYESVPIVVGTNKNLLPENNIESNVYCQTFGQWIYFRQNNPWTGKEYYIDADKNINTDLSNSVINSTEQLSLIKRTFDKEVVKNYYILNWGELTDEGFFPPDYNLTENKSDEIVYPNYNNESTSEYVIDKENNDLLPISHSSNYNILSNKYLLMYEHFVGNQGTDKIYLSSDTPISLFIDKYCSTLTSNNLPKNTIVQYLNGGFLYPHIPSKTFLKCDNHSNEQYYRLDIGKSISIPIEFEYYLDGKNQTAVTKTIAFDLRTSLLKNPDNFIINVTSTYDNTRNNYELNNNYPTLSDTLTD